LEGQWHGMVDTEVTKYLKVCSTFTLGVVSGAHKLERWLRCKPLQETQDNLTRPAVRAM
jgi:hypothetical protein